MTRATIGVGEATGIGLFIAGSVGILAGIVFVGSFPPFVGLGLTDVPRPGGNGLASDLDLSSLRRNCTVASTFGVANDCGSTLEQATNNNTRVAHTTIFKLCMVLITVYSLSLDSSFTQTLSN